ncbi:paraquat-inducible protein B-like protein [Haemophilus influenzae R3021]|uniref:Paraquat-inducible protein B-like protein n=1 Tax=Haemophilus influenzae R3021 TaxID=375432 RepID=A4N5R0_HAEIF|nr:paraquat-inducible protein B-like protein [Haemophilus influenzae R3021]
MLKGGISFSTPAEKEIQPQAQPNKRFLLQINRPEEVQTWGSGALSK